MRELETRDQQPVHPSAPLLRRAARHLTIAWLVQSEGTTLRGPATIHFISSDTCSDTIAKLFGACCCGNEQFLRDILQNKDIAQMCVCV